MAMTWEEMRSQLQSAPGQWFETQASINLYKSPDGESLVTQAAAGRQFSVETIPSGLAERSDASPEGRAIATQAMPSALYVRLREDDYPGWLLPSDLDKVALATNDKRDEKLERPDTAMTRADINAQLPKVLAFVQAALMTPNEYLWGGTVAPHYDCSGLMQAAFWSEGIWLPRDAYQQEAFLQPLPVSSKTLAAGDYSALLPGDLVFFGPPERATHVGLYVGEGCYIHSSGKAMGRNGIAVDQLTASAAAPTVSRGYFEIFRGAGRVVKSYRGGQAFAARKA